MKNSSRVIVMTVVLLIGISVWLPGLRLRRVGAQGPPALMGSYGFSALAPYAGTNNSSPLAALGVLTFDGAGNIMGSETVVQPDTSPNPTTVQSQTVRFVGTYTVNADGTGTLIIQISGGPTIPVSFVITDGGAGLMFVQTGGSNSLLTGTARKQ